MKRFLQVSIVVTSIVWGLTGCVGAPNSNVAVAQADGPSTAPKNPSAAPRKPASSPKKTMSAFRSEQELTAYLHELAEKQKRESRAKYGASNDTVSVTPAAPMQSMASKSAGRPKEEESVTKRQPSARQHGYLLLAALSLSWCPRSVREFSRGPQVEQGRSNE